MTIDADIGYEFVSDPPILADIGFLNFTVDDLDLQFNLTSNYHDYNMTLNVTSVHASLEKFDLGFDGLNDFLFVVSGFIDKVFNIIT